MYKVPCTAYGWGVHSKSGRPATHLQVLNVTAGHGEEACPCSKRYQEKRLVCLKPVKGQGICVGDSGSALVCGGEGVGVAHMIIDRRGCSFTKVPDLKCGARDTIGVYMFLCPYLDWISGYVRGVPGTPQSCRGSRTDRPSDHVLLFLYCLLLFANIYIY
ncbi:hypothetical protein AAG570_005786 [Ranatra chinensis]|uniref:Peptidase S1 domain-containing protein n=1 Tax=Ranatra chinensis TaxID=642074 RepID=A0ABD0XYF8_9HEMI